MTRVGIFVDACFLCVRKGVVGEGLVEKEKNRVDICGESDIMNI